MSSIQERLQLKRVPLDTWNIKEQLCLASAVVRSGDQNWMSVSRALKTVGEPNRPPDWYSQKSCAAHYGALLEHVETPKRKKRSSEGAVETPQESILKRLTQERIVEIQKTLAEMNQQYDLVKNEVLEVRNSATSEERLREIWTSIEARARSREREAARRAAWLRERDERRARSDRPWRPAGAQPATPNTPSSPSAPASPLLTSLLKSSPVVTTPQHITHPANVVDTMSPSVTAPTLSMLLEKCAAGGGGGGQHDSKHAAIEHIKSQLVQIEHQLKAGNPAGRPGASPPPPPAPPLDIDDIEIKAEDVYAFRDVDIHIPPVTTMHKPNARVFEKPVKIEDSESTPAAPENEPVIIDEHIIKEEPETIAEHVEEEVLVEEIETAPEAPIEEPELVKEPTPEAEVKIAFPEVKFPTTEIKVIQPEDQKIKEEIKEVEIPLPPQQQQQHEEPKMPDISEIPVPPPIETVEEEISEPIPVPAEEPKPEELPEEPIIEQPVEDIPLPEIVDHPDPSTIPLPPETNEAAEAEDQVPDVVEPPPLPEEVAPPQAEVVEHTIEERLEMMEKGLVEEPPREPARGSTPAATRDQLKADLDEDSIPLKEMMKEECSLQLAEAEVKAEPVEGEDPHTETDDDTPMELSREEEKDGKKRKDYSRKKKSESRTWSGSESAEASAPESPHASDAERQHRLWKKSVMLVYSRLCTHKYASLFQRPITDEEAPGYSMVVKRPMDMSTIRKNIDSGLIRTTAEFQRAVLLMLSNALMYNSSEHSVYTMARDMHKEASCQLGMLLAAQAHAGLLDAAPATRKRRRADPPAPHADKRQH